MSTKIFVNLPVRDLKRSMDFFTKLGYKFNAQFTDEKATCMIVSDDINVMLLTEPFFKTFTKKEIADPHKTTEVILALMVGSKAKVDEMMTAAISAGGNEYREKMDHGWMYQRSFSDPDGHQWELFFMDASQMPKA